MRQVSVTVGTPLERTSLPGSRPSTSAPNYCPADRRAAVETRSRGLPSQVAVRGVAGIVGEVFGGSGRVELGHLLVDLERESALGPEDGREGLDRQVAAANKPLIALLQEQGAGKPDQGGVVGEDPDDVRAPADLAVDALQRVGASELGTAW